MNPLQESLSKKLRYQQKRLTKITQTELLKKEALNADQKELLEKKTITIALIAEFQEQLALLATIATTPEVSSAAPSVVVSPVTAAVALPVKTNDASLLRSTVLLCDDLLTMEGLSDRHYTLLQSVQSLLSSGPPSDAITAQFNVLVTKPKTEVKCKPKAIVQQASSETIVEVMEGTPCFINDSELGQTAPQQKDEKKPKRVQKPRKEKTQDNEKVERKPLKVVEVKANVQVDKETVIPSVEKKKTINYVLGTKGITRSVVEV